jgi:hypothetical protein
MELPADSQLRWILRHAASLLQLGAEPVGGLIQPTADFFPDRYDGSPDSLVALTRRIQKHAGLSDLSIELAVFTPEGQTQTVSCSSGACGGTGKLEARLDRVGRRDDGSYAVAVSVGELKDPVVLTTSLVRAIACMFMVEAGAYEGVPPAEREPLTDLAAALLGFGVLVANGSHIYMKGCSGVQVHSATRMPVDELTVALALFCKLHDVPERAASRHLELTPREHFEEAWVWASSNASLCRMLRERPAAIEADTFSLSPARSWLSRVLGVGQKKRALTPEEEIAELERSVASGAVKALPKRAVDAEKQRKMAELRALVDESLEG